MIRPGQDPLIEQLVLRHLRRVVAAADAAGTGRRVREGFAWLPTVGTNEMYAGKGTPAPPPGPPPPPPPVTPTGTHQANATNFKPSIAVTGGEGTSAGTAATVALAHTAATLLRFVDGPDETSVELTPPEVDHVEFDPMGGGPTGQLYIYFNQGINIPTYGGGECSCTIPGYGNYTDDTGIDEERFGVTVLAILMTRKGSELGPDALCEHTFPGFTSAESGVSLQGIADYPVTVLP
jgi:hypothetical protein